MAPSVSTDRAWSSWHDRLHRQLLNNPQLLPKGKTLLLAVSGGQDSMAMLGLVNDLQRLHGWQLLVWHGNHGWHPGSTEIAAELEDWCEDRRLSFSCDRANTEAVKTEAGARHWRYKQLIQHALEHSSDDPQQRCQHVLTGHTGSDRAETLLLNLARGADLSGLSSLRGQRNLAEGLVVVRPLLNFSRAETLQICKQLTLPIWLDPSNQNLELSRNRVRHDVLPVLEELHPGCSLRMARLAERLSHHQSTQETLASLALQSLQSERGLERRRLSQLPLASRMTLLAIWINQEGGPTVNSSQLEALCQAVGASQPPGCRDLANGWRISWQRESVQLDYSG
mgnify:CR=1 FL=1